MYDLTTWKKHIGVGNTSGYSFDAVDKLLTK